MGNFEWVLQEPLRDGAFPPATCTLDEFLLRSGFPDDADWWSQVESQARDWGAAQDPPIKFSLNNTNPRMPSVGIWREARSQPH
jgi:hypothetical protein